MNTKIFEIAFNTGSGSLQGLSDVISLHHPVVLIFVSFVGGQYYW